MQSISKKFITENDYKGTWDEERQCMEGFGVYQLRNGNVYRGFFKNGLAHGCGVWEFDIPYNCRVITTSDNGKLVSIHDVIYADGIQLKNSDQFGFKHWNYCTEIDRRFAEEIFRGLYTVGVAPLSARKLKPGEYDAAGGIYMPNTGFKIKPVTEFSQDDSFVACIKERDWIEHHCAVGLKAGERRLPSKSFQKKILNANIRAFDESRKDALKNFAN